MMQARAIHVAAAAGLLAFAATGAHGHALGSGGGGLAGGLAHPLMGLDHLLAMVAVGLWAAQLGSKAAWQVPLAFVAMVAAGFGLSRLGVSLGAVEGVVVASVVVLGSVVAGAVRVPAVSGAALVALFAVFHGHAHGTGMPPAASAWAYAAGLVISTAGLHLLGLGLGLSLRRRPALARLGGAAIAASGLALMGGL